jgi:hypothetical protein
MVVRSTSLSSKISHTLPNTTETGISGFGGEKTFEGEQNFYNRGKWPKVRKYLDLSRLIEWALPNS